MVAPMAVPLKAMGPYKQCISFCSEARKNGHEVITFAARDAVWKDIDGIKNFTAKTPKLLGCIPEWCIEKIIKPFFLKSGSKWQKMNSFEHVLWSLGLIYPDYFFSDMQMCRDILNEEKPDFVLAGRYSVILAAKQMGIPVAVVIDKQGLSSFASSPEKSKRLRKKLNLRNYGNFESILDIIFISDLIFVPGIQAFSETGIPNASYIGPLKRTHPEMDTLQNNRTVILTYPGVSGIDQKRLIKLLNRSFEGSQYQVIFVTKEKHHIDSGCVKIVNKFNDAMLAQTKLFIHHGGQNSCWDSIFQGIASLIIPEGHFEREENAVRLCEAGTSLLWNQKESDDRFTKRIHQLMTDKQFELSAMKLRREFTKTGGWSQALTEMEQHLKERNIETRMA